MFEFGPANELGGAGDALLDSSPPSRCRSKLSVQSSWMKSIWILFLFCALEHLFVIQLVCANSLFIDSYFLPLGMTTSFFYTSNVVLLDFKIHI